MSIDSIKKADAFLSISSQYKLGDLTTESAHPATKNLSSLSSENLPEAISILKEIDCQTISILCEHKSEIYHLKEIINKTLEAGSNIYFCGCGATGRLSLSIETIWRQVNKEMNIKDRVFSFMAGGDVALIRSIENFEDFPDYGARQLIEAGFGNDDLLIGSTEGGETPFVIGAVEKATEISGRKPFFLYCNPDDILSEVAERSRLVIENPDIEKINLTVGPMAITGSTRMQSSTILLAAAGIALLYCRKDNSEIEKALETFRNFWNSVDIKFIEKFIIKETDYYRRGDYLLYDTDNQLGITVITDTTERSPTFSLFPFENVNEADQKLSLCYLYMPEAEDSEEAWRSLLWREPRALEWPDINGIASSQRLLGFDFSKTMVPGRESRNKSIVHHLFRIHYEHNGISFSLEEENHFLPAPFSSPLFVHLVLKMILNIHSTLIMGRLGRYEGNIMTYVRASNNKLIDRAIRYIDIILQNKNIRMKYEDIAYILFEMIEKTPVDSAIVLVTAGEILKRTNKN